MIRRRWDIDRPQLEAIYATGASAQQKFREHIAWFGLSQQRLQSTYGFVPGVFNMAVGVNAPQSTRELIAERRNAHLAMITGAIHAIFAEEGLADDHIRWWATIAAQLISGANIEARLNNSLAPYDSLPDSVMAVLGLCAPPLLAKARPPID